MSKNKANGLTSHDLVVLAVMAEGPVHGYRLLQILQERDVQDWAAMSKPQVYYSLKKLSRLELILPVGNSCTHAGPEREVLALSPTGQQALTRGLDNVEWATQRPPPPFLTWMALSSHLNPKSRTQIISHRRTYLKQELVRERKTWESLEQDSSPMAVSGKLMVSLTIRQFELELEWLEEVDKALNHKK